MQTNYIAAGFDKVRSDGGVVVWDVNVTDFDSTSSSSNIELRDDSFRSVRTLPERVDKPIYEVGLSESAVSTFAFFHCIFIHTYYV
jgi:acetolactate synthase regulatory subunit